MPQVSSVSTYSRVASSLLGAPYSPIAVASCRRYVVQSELGRAPRQRIINLIEHGVRLVDLGNVNEIDQIDVKLDLVNYVAKIDRTEAKLDRIEDKSEQVDALWGTLASLWIWQRRRR